QRRSGVLTSLQYGRYWRSAPVDPTNCATALLAGADIVSSCTMKTEPSSELRSQFGEIDIYLFDQLLRGRFDGRRRILDAGCGSGRNLPYLLAHGFEIFAIDEDPAAVKATKQL